MLRRSTFAFLGAALLSASLAAEIHAQPAAPAPTGSAAHAPTPPKPNLGKPAGTDKNSKPVGADAADAGAPGDAGSALPQGHPPVDMPEGHPPTDMPQGHPPTGGRSPRGAPPGHGETLSEPPEDTVGEDPSLRPGELIVTVRDVQERPIPRAPIKLAILHQSVAKGDAREELTRTADEGGVVRFEGLTVGSASQYRVITTSGPASFTLGPFAMGAERGKRAVIHAYEVSTSIDEVLVGVQAAVYVSLREDSLSVEHLFSIFNLGPVAWVPNLTIALPEGFKAFNKPDNAEEGVHFAEVKGTGAALRGTIGPGRHDATFRYQVPLTNDEKQTIAIQLPPRVAQARVMVEASRKMGVEVPGFPAAQRDQNRDGKRILVTGRQVSREEGGLRRLEVTITGLPTQGYGRWVAVVLAATALAGGGAFVYARRGKEDDIDEETRDDLIEARDALLDEIAELERAHRRGDIGPKTYARIKNALLDSLARIVSMLEKKPTAEPPPPPPPKAPVKRSPPKQARASGAEAPRKST